MWKVLAHCQDMSNVIQHPFFYINNSNNSKNANTAYKVCTQVSKFDMITDSRLVSLNCENHLWLRCFLMVMHWSCSEPLRVALHYNNNSCTCMTLGDRSGSGPERVHIEMAIILNTLAQPQATGYQYNCKYVQHKNCESHAVSTKTSPWWPDVPLNVWPARLHIVGTSHTITLALWEGCSTTRITSNFSARSITIVILNTGKVIKDAYMLSPVNQARTMVSYKLHGILRQLHYNLHGPSQ